MIVPSLRMTSAPIRPETAWKALLVRPFWTIGFGPCPAQAPPRVAPAGAAEAIVAACLPALVRNVAAWVRVSGLSPASSRLQ
jgi:hypothetical protein